MMLSPWAALPACVSFAFRRLFVGHRQIAAVILLILPLVIGLLFVLAVRGNPDRPVSAEGFFARIMFFYNFYFMLMLLGIIYGTALSATDIEDGTASYLFLTSLPRWAIALIHIAVAAVVLTVMIFLSILGTRAVWRMGTGIAFDLNDFVLCARYGAIAFFGMTYYLAFCAFCGYAFRRPVPVAVVIGVLIEVILTSLPMKLAAFTATNNLRALIFYGILGGEPERLLRYVKNYTFPDYMQASLTLTLTTGLWLAGMMVAAMNRDIEGRMG